MALQIALTVALSAIAFGVPLLWLYMNERMKNIAREPTEKVLADYRLSHEQLLATLNADNHRRSEEFSLFKRRQHEVYPELYAELKKATDGYAGVVNRTDGFYEGPDFRTWSLARVRAYVARREITEEDASAAIAAAELGNRDLLGSAMDVLELRTNRRDAWSAFVRFRNYESLNELYLSQSVALAVDRARRATVLVTVYADEADDYDHKPDKEWRTKYREARDDMVSATRAVLETMRVELRRGETGP